MRKFILSITLFLIMAAFQPANSQNTKQIIKEVNELATELRRAYEARDINALLVYWGKPEGLIFLEGESLSLDNLRIRYQNWWNNRKDESWVNEKVIVIPLSETSAFMQIVFSGHYTWIPTGVTWEYKSSAFFTALVKKQNEKWKIVLSHDSGAGKEVKNN